MPAINSRRIGLHERLGDLSPEKQSALRLVVFMQSKFIAVDRVPLDKPRGRGHKPRATDDLSIRVVRLRTSEPNLTAAIAAKPGDRRWASRWMVRGHYRRQWHPSVKEHRVRWIAGYVKGPTGKPVRSPVIVVKR